MAGLIDLLLLLAFVSAAPGWVLLLILLHLRTRKENRW